MIFRGWLAALPLASVAIVLALGACTSAGPRAQSAQQPAAIVGAVPPGAAIDPRVLMIDQATAMLGEPYRWGGSGPGGFDCSGLVFFAARGAGIRVPRTAQEQQGSGIPIGREAVRAGDLVFMHLQHKELHVGIALSNERFIHAPSSGGRVRIDSLDAVPYLRAYLGARRIIAEP